MVLFLSIQLDYNIYIYIHNQFFQICIRWKSDSAQNTDWYRLFWQHQDTGPNSGLYFCQIWTTFLRYSSESNMYNLIDSNLKNYRPYQTYISWYCQKYLYQSIFQISDTDRYRPEKNWLYMYMYMDQVWFTIWHNTICHVK